MKTLFLTILAVVFCVAIIALGQQPVPNMSTIGASPGQVPVANYNGPTWQWPSNLTGITASGSGIQTNGGSGVNNVLSNLSAASISVRNPNVALVSVPVLLTNSENDRLQFRGSGFGLFAEITEDGFVGGGSGLTGIGPQGLEDDNSPSPGQVPAYVNATTFTWVSAGAGGSGILTNGGSGINNVLTNAHLAAAFIQNANLAAVSAPILITNSADDRIQFKGTGFATFAEITEDGFVGGGSGLTAIGPQSLEDNNSPSAGQVPSYVNATTFTWITPGGSPGGSDTQVQYNDGGAFGAEPAFTYNKTSDILTVPNFTTTGQTILGGLAYAYGLSAGGVVTGYLAIAADGEIRPVEAPSGGGIATNGGTGVDNIFTNPIIRIPGYIDLASGGNTLDIQVGPPGAPIDFVTFGGDPGFVNIYTNALFHRPPIGDGSGWTNLTLQFAPNTVNFEADKTNVFINAGLAKANRHKFSLTATNHFLLQITNALVDGQEIVVRVKQDATGNWQGYTTNTISGGDSIPIPADKSLSILPAPPTANKVTYLGFIYNSTSNVWHYWELREGF